MRVIFALLQSTVLVSNVASKTVRVTCPENGDPCNGVPCIDHAYWNNFNKDGTSLKLTDWDRVKSYCLDQGNGRTLTEGHLLVWGVFHQGSQGQTRCDCKWRAEALHKRYMNGEHDALSYTLEEFQEGNLMDDKLSKSEQENVGGVSSNALMREKYGALDSSKTYASPCEAAAELLEDLNIWKNCSNIVVPEAQTYGGGWCLAVMSETGWVRSTTVNPVQSVLIATNQELDILPLFIGSNSGGTMLSTRYFTYRNYPSATVWTYPCYMLHDNFKTPCYFHTGFGDISDNCESVKFNLIGAASQLVMAPLMKVYGGPMGTLSVWVNDE